jgi:divalent metal cation (Fe/Co/Zn/Cd) transporter
MGTAIYSKMDRAVIARRGRNLEYFTIAWATLEATIALITAIKSNSLSLAGFGFDSLIEVVSGAALLWRMSHEMDHHRRHRAEHVSLRIAGVCLLALGCYVLIEATSNLWMHRSSEMNWIGVGVTTAALICMPLLSRAKRKVGRALNSTAMMTSGDRALRPTSPCRIRHRLGRQCSGFAAGSPAAAGRHPFPERPSLLHPPFPCPLKLSSR